MIVLLVVMVAARLTTVGASSADGTFAGTSSSSRLSSAVDTAPMGVGMTHECKSKGQSQSQSQTDFVAECKLPSIFGDFKMGAYRCVMRHLMLTWPELKSRTSLQHLS